jgi:hypothetical protein
MNYSLKHFYKTMPAFALLFVFQFGIAQTTHINSFTNKTDTLHLFLIGNSFSQNASRYLPQLAKEGGHHLVIGRAEIGGCSLQKHWELAELADANPNDPKGKPYNGKSLCMLLSERVWEVVTLQQSSMLSGDPATYMPYARKLYNYIKNLQPNAKVVLHQTWAYRSDSKDFSQIGTNRFAKNEKEMWQKSRVAYHAIAAELGIKIIPVGDAFHKVNSGPKAFRKDKKYDATKAVYPTLPDQKYSLNNGYYWDGKHKLSFDSHHANDAGCYLGALVWYTFLFDESPSGLKFAPQNVQEEFASYLKKTAKSIVICQNDE